MITAWVDAVAFWSPRLTDWSAAARALRGEALPSDVSAPRPAPQLLPANERRRAPDTVAVSMEVAARACADAGVAPAQVASVFASTHGDLAITDYMCATLAEAPETLSPTRFHNSVHNAAAGYWSIATGCMAPYTAVSAWRRTFAAGLLESLTQAHSEARPVLMVAYDIEAKGPLASVVHSEGVVSCALVISPCAGARSVARLRWRAYEADGITEPQPRSEAARALQGNAMAASLPLLELLAHPDGGDIRYGLGPALGLEIAVDMTSVPT